MANVYIDWGNKKVVHSKNEPTNGNYELLGAVVGFSAKFVPETKFVPEGTQSLTQNTINKLMLNFIKNWDKSYLTNYIKKGSTMKSPPHPENTTGGINKTCADVISNIVVYDTIIYTFKTGGSKRFCELYVKYALKNNPPATKAEAVKIFKTLLEKVKK